MCAVIGTYSGKEAREPLGLLKKSSGAGCKQLALQMLFAGSSLALAGSIVFAQEGAKYAEARAASPAGRVVTRTVDSGAESVIARSTFWNGACGARAVTVTIKQPTANGTTSVKEGLNTVVANPRFGTAGKCVGKQIMGKQVLYRSKPGFHGGDQLVYESVSDKGERALTTVKIDVR